MPCMGGRAAGALLVAALALGARGGESDPIALELADGRVLRGRIVAESEESLQLEVESSGGIRGRIDVPRAQVKATRRPGPDPGAVERNERAAVARALPVQERGQALLRLAEEEALRGDPVAAAELYQEAGRAEPALLDQTDVAAARALLAAGQHARAEEAIQRALQRNPKNAQAAAAGREVAAGLEALARELLEPGIAAWSQGDPRRALRLLVRAVEALPARVLDAASTRLQEEAGLSLAQVMIDCRLQAPCEACDGDGVIDCPLGAGNNASTRCKLGMRSSVLRAERFQKVEVARRARCERCDGVGSLACEACEGMGLHLTRPTAYERETWLAALQGELGGLEERVQRLLPRVEQGAQGATGSHVEAVVTAQLTELLGVLQRVRGYSRALARLDPRAGAIGGGDLRRTAQAAGERMSTLLGTAGGLLYLMGEKRYEDAVNVSREAVSPAVRSARARQAWELVNQARAYTAEALRLNPASAGLLGGDLRRRQALMDRFLDRTWKTYVALRIAEQQAAKDTAIAALLEQAPEAARAAVDPLLKQDQGDQ